VFDNLERAAQHAETATDVKSLADGVGMVVRLFVDTLGRLGVERVSALGQAFDPALHEAVQQLETSEHPPGSVAAEVQPGYRMGDRLVRPAMVVVAKPPSQ
jgi:molecular chaperone GrpE